MREENEHLVGEDVGIHSRRNMNYGPGDRFLRDIYKYHQQGGFWIYVLADILWITRFLFLAFFGSELLFCTQWKIFFDRNTNYSLASLADVFTPPRKCWASFGLVHFLVIASMGLFLTFKSSRMLFRLLRMWKVHLFFRSVLQLPNASLGLLDMPWYVVQQRLLQSKFPSSLNVNDLTELIVAQRILRKDNYLIAMVDQEVIPLLKAHTIVYLPKGYLMNLKILLFGLLSTLFGRPWQLDPRYLRYDMRTALARRLALRSCILGIVNIVVAPTIWLFQILSLLCSVAGRLRYNPSSLFGRQWSAYARCYLRHYNELPHQFLVRMGQAYEPACKYLSCFASRKRVMLAETAAFVFGSLTLALFLMGTIQEKVITLPGCTAIILTGGLLTKAALKLAPIQPVVESPRSLFIDVLQHTHRAKEHWIAQSGTHQVLKEFTQLFQYQHLGYLNELISPVVTPIILLFFVPFYALKIVDFLRNYSSFDKMTGYVCTFSLLELEICGGTKWYVLEQCDKQQPADQVTTKPTSDWGKCEVSMMNFHKNNPNCQLPASAGLYMKKIASCLEEDSRRIQELPPPAVVGQGSATATVFLPTLCGPATMPQSLFHSDAADAVTQTCGYKNASLLPGPLQPESRSFSFAGTVMQSLPNISRRQITESLIQSNITDLILRRSGNIRSRPYEPYRSDLKNDISSHLFGFEGKGFGLSLHLTEDTSSIILYMHELAHRHARSRHFSALPEEESEPSSYQASTGGHISVPPRSPPSSSAYVRPEFISLAEGDKP
ncbi:unnamed protein product [Calicophoron daubneyi]|uniref:Autophagy-related protein 9 n=1 Tax=Calicophoron daubneyi TaxID=300641 RepID=A0AAV2TPC1_CALDB